MVGRVWRVWICLGVGGWMFLGREGFGGFRRMGERSRIESERDLHCKDFL